MVNNLIVVVVVVVGQYSWYKSKEQPFLGIHYYWSEKERNNECEILWAKSWCLFWAIVGWCQFSTMVPTLHIKMFEVSHVKYTRWFWFPTGCLLGESYCELTELDSIIKGRSSCYPKWCMTRIQLCPSLGTRCLWVTVVFSHCQSTDDNLDV